MKIAFHGAAPTITGSKCLLTLEKGTQIILDCGMVGAGRISFHIKDYIEFIRNTILLVGYCYLHSLVVN